MTVTYMNVYLLSLELEMGGWLLQSPDKVVLGRDIQKSGPVDWYSFTKREVKMGKTLHCKMQWRSWE